MLLYNFFQYCLYIGEVLLISIENKKVVNVKETNSEISCISWVQEKLEPKPKDVLNLKDEEQNDYMKYIVSITSLPSFFLILIINFRIFRNYILEILYLHHQ